MVRSADSWLTFNQIPQSSHILLCKIPILMVLTCEPIWRFFFGIRFIHALLDAITLYPYAHISFALLLTQDRLIFYHHALLVPLSEATF